MQGWIGNTTWRNVIQFKYPAEHRDLRLADHAYGRGFFLHNFSYESAGRGLRIAPLFVLESLTTFDPDADPIWAKLGYAIGVAAAVLFLIFMVMLSRDKRRSVELQREMVRRRQARRARRAQEEGDTGSPGTPGSIGTSPS